MHKLFLKIKNYAELVMLSHTLFSLPFGIIAMVWAYGGWPPLAFFGWIFVALFFARLGANAFNRIADRFIDARNPRTAGRHLPSGTVKLAEAAAICAVCVIGVAVPAFMLNAACLILLPAAGVLIFGYSYTKRFTWLCHYILGAACACAPLGAWIAVNGSPTFDAPFWTLILGWLNSPTPIILSAAVCLYVAGFDISYATQDIAIDRAQRIRSIPSRFGEKRACVIAACSHLIAVCLFLFLGFYEGRGLLYFTGVLIAAALLFMQARAILRRAGKRSFNRFFTDYNVNRVVSLSFFILTMADYFL
jgi:4-hydroxybenzoate polyprenyltransferase